MLKVKVSQYAVFILWNYVNEQNTYDKILITVFLFRLHSDNSLTLLHYIVKTYLKMCEDPLNAALPVPEPSDVEQAAAVQFDDIKQQLLTLRKDLEG